ncbi:ABC transporter permease [Paracoccus litorisediminis]|jgi:ABC-type nitrate/sulfonate/bicarbonate transport system permease component|uniref:ABC transporter permease subunit n=1 Tax=Paracoccus litorisediminis TaxID=2006130 RepID=A0A844HV07_9RHOB|nr:ABC transporter permease [Paracoccus litorisediminis]MTH61332.1 ABC transporter permease subunit [Paracoccus litorisediminis]
MTRALLWSRGAVSLIFVLALWQAVALSGAVPAKFFPGIPAIIDGARQMIATGELPRNEILTLGRALTGLVLASVAGIALALLSDASPFFDRGFRTISSLLQPVPPAAVVPMAIFALGLGIKLYIFIILLVSIWGPYLNGAAALRAVPREQILTGRMLGLSPAAIMFRIKLPAAMPQIFAGIRYAAAVSLIAVVVAEMLAGRDGIGFLLVRKSFSIRIPETYALMFVTMFNGVLLALLVNLARRVLTGWHVRQTGASK